MLSTPAAEVRVRVMSADAAVGDELAATLWAGGIPLTTLSDPQTVVVAVGSTLDTAIDACGQAVPRLVIAERFNRSGVRYAVRLGVQALLRTGDFDSTRLVEVVQAVRHGDGRFPHEVLLGLLSSDGFAEPTSGPTPLTPRQTTVLTLMADGYPNSAIARSLSCSEHTVKNVIYELMARLLARNRAHAVACAVRAGLI